MWYFLFYFFANVVAAFVYINFNAARIVRFNHRYNKRIQARNIPSIIYYVSTFLYLLLRVCLSIVFLPVYIWIVRPIRKQMSVSAIRCFEKSAPFLEDSMTDIVLHHVPSHKIKKHLFRCEFWNAYNTSSSCSNAYQCVKFCPCFTEKHPFFLFSDKDYAQYLSSVEDEYDLVDLAENHL